MIQFLGSIVNPVPYGTLMLLSSDKLTCLNLQYLTERSSHLKRERKESQFQVIMDQFSVLINKYWYMYRPISASLTFFHDFPKYRCMVLQVNHNQRYKTPCYLYCHLWSL